MAKKKERHTNFPVIMLQNVSGIWDEHKKKLVIASFHGVQCIGNVNVIHVKGPLDFVSWDSRSGSEF